MMETIFLVNGQLKYKNFYTPSSAAISSSDEETFAIISGGQHPRGAHFAFCDGSVKFIKDSIDSMPVSPTGYGPGMSYDSTNRVYVIDPTPYRPGIFQKLATRASGEVISSDAF